MFLKTYLYWDMFFLDLVLFRVYDANEMLSQHDPDPI
jgi:hypothetical protein